MVEPQKTEAYTIVHLPTSNNGKTNISVRVKVDTGAGGNVIPLRVFERLHPRKMDQNGDQEMGKSQEGFNPNGMLQVLQDLPYLDYLLVRVYR